MRITLLIFCALFSTASFAGFEIEQSVSFQTNDIASNQEFIWKIQGNEFRLDTTRDGEKKHFVFNGRVFYICGRLGAAQIDMIRKFNVSDKSFLASLESGACQELPMDYGVRFLLSPFEAVGNVDVTGGLGTSVGVSDVVFKITTLSGSLGGTTCKGFSRSFELTDRMEPEFKRNVSETPCIAESIKWRQGISRQLGMALIRSPGGQPSYQAIMNDISNHEGFTLNTSGKMVGRDNFGKDFSSKFAVKATKVTEKVFSAVDIGLPKGFDIVDTRGISIALPAIANAPKNEQKVAERQAGGLDMLVKILILGGNPAASVIEALKSDDKKDTGSKSK